MGESGHIEMQSNQAAQAFASGSLGILMRSSVNTRRILDQVGPKFPVVAKSIPIASADGKLPVGGKAVVMLAKDQSKQDAAWKFLKFVVAEEGQMQMATASGYAPVNDAALATLQNTIYKDKPAYQITPSVLPRIVRWDSFPGANAVKAVDAVRNHMQQVITLKVKPDEALSDLAKDVRGMIKQ
ncbi:extracellular solute-binding protein (plasmid) [Phyllobacterium zundukense]|uniref:Extracellular solute-binding protein n=1 Tax=Phyllobacterium zundukense TaxID=1867719 RepID=A0ACD4CW65_9HYPH|nr:extracellular solute-binding protein [Phyllobacterium zundukense]